MREDIDPAEVKKQSEEVILKASGRICDGLPYLDITQPRDLEEVVDRALVLNAMLQIHFRAPTQLVAQWLESNGLESALSPVEVDILSRESSQLSDQEKINLYWYIEALWALLWATQLIDRMPFHQGIENFMASLCPALQDNEDGGKFRERMKLRPHAELFRANGPPPVANGSMTVLSEYGVGKRSGVPGSGNIASPPTVPSHVIVHVFLAPTLNSVGFGANVEEVANPAR